MTKKKTLGRWKDIVDDREKYQAYLCSREWAVMKRSVHDRAGGYCERCELFEIDAVHHLTYERKYNEDLEDLAGWCKHCHAFTHGKSDVDPASLSHDMAMYLRLCRDRHLRPFPPAVVYGESQQRQYDAFLCGAINTILGMEAIADSCLGYPVDVNDAAVLLNGRIPYDYLYYSRWGPADASDTTYGDVVALTGACYDGILDDFPEDDTDL
jgi:hypothetical protein